MFWYDVDGMLWKNDISCVIQAANKQDAVLKAIQIHRLRVKVKIMRVMSQKNLHPEEDWARVRRVTDVALDAKTGQVKSFKAEPTFTYMRIKRL